MKKKIKSSTLSTRADDLFDNIENILDIQEDLLSKNISQSDQKTDDKPSEEKKLLRKIKNSSYFLLY